MASCWRLWMASSMSPWPLIMITSTSGARALTALSRLMPSMTGILMSVSTMSGANVSNPSKAARPFSAVRTR